VNQLFLKKKNLVVFWNPPAEKLFLFMSIIEQKFQHEFMEKIAISCLAFVCIFSKTCQTFWTPCIRMYVDNKAVLNK